MKAIIAAVDANWGIGKDKKIPWYYPEDFAWFKEHTKGAVVIMGYNTYAEIAEKFNYPETGKLLPGRISYIISSRDIPCSPSVKTGYTSLEDAIGAAEEKYPDRNIFLIGGSQIFEEGLDYADKVYLTKINKSYDCNSFFPQEKLYDKFVRTSSVQSNDNELSFCIFKKSEIIG